LYDSARSATVLSLTEVTALVVGSKKLEKVLGHRLRETIYRNTMVIAIEQD
jgi:CRP-like cAMP-binding protein